MNKCVRHEHLDPAAFWSDADMLDHFLHCVTPAEQADRWARLRRQAEAGRMCLDFDHEGLLAQWRARQADELSRPLMREEDVPVPDMSVTVTWPADRGQMQGVTYGRESAPEADTLTALDRRIVRTLLEHALSQVPIAYPVNPPVPVQLPGWH